MAIGGGVELELDCDGPWCEMQLAACIGCEANK